MEVLSERVKKLMDEKGVTAYEVSRMTGISQSAMSRVLSNATQKMSIDNITLLAKYFNVNYDWLSTGRGERSVFQYPSNSDRGKGASDVSAAYVVPAQDHDRIGNLIHSNMKLADAIDSIADSNKILAVTNREQSSNNTRLIENQNLLLSRLISLMEDREER